MTAGAKPIVLVVDDEASMRELQSRILTGGGYQVIEADGAATAANILKSGQHIDLLIADLDMPDVTGEEMVLRIRAVKPGQKVLYVSGTVDRLLDARQILDEREAFLDKPFTAKGLLEAVSLLLYDTLTPPWQR